ncbi:VQ motif-containing protein 1-like [Henckelia pumila]|uniref:VQ motif-containing protein 1-like n=1 Tax=Henckelia pumila TaxID=405737 RepID=UPI003C6DD9E3
MAGRRGNIGVKVVIINTQYVETDAMSFKSVVQNLTGKDSHIHPAANYYSQRQPPPPPPVRYSTDQAACDVAPFLSRGMSFRDFEWMSKDMPPLDELLQALR